MAVFATVQIVMGWARQPFSTVELRHLLTRGLPSSALVLLGLLSAAPAHGQLEDLEVNVNRFAPAAGPRNLVVTRGARSDGHLAYSLGALFGYAKDLFKVLGCADATTTCNDDELREVHVVEHLVTGDLMASLTPIPRVQIGLRVPLTFVQGEGLGPGGQPNPNGDISGLGVADTEIEAKWRALGELSDTHVFGGGVVVTVPIGVSSQGGSFVTDESGSAGLRGIYDGRFGDLKALLNVTPTLRKTRGVGGTSTGSELRYAVGVGYDFGARVGASLEAFGATRFSSDAGTNPLEVDAALQLPLPLAGLGLNVGGGGSPSRGIGAPSFRGFLGVAYVVEVTDRDGDGIADPRDLCPISPEDFDGQWDSDGCPEFDDDGDRVPDVRDRCPLDPEDIDGWADGDGCPDPDNDGDGLFDGRDRCPDAAENSNGFQDDDGCPDKADSDGDGMIDSTDKCPSEAEDTDGFQDDDGCIDPDDDGDGVLDARDECPGEQETHNGRDDDDGCPD